MPKPKIFSRVKNLFVSNKAQKDFEKKICGLFKEGKEVHPYLEEAFQSNKKLALKLFVAIFSMAENNSDDDEEKLIGLINLWEKLDAPSCKRYEENLKKEYLKEVKRLDISPLLEFQKTLRPENFPLNSRPLGGIKEIITEINSTINDLKIFKSSGKMSNYGAREMPTLLVDINRNNIIKISILKLFIGGITITLLNSMIALSIDVQKHKDKLSSIFDIAVTNKTDGYYYGLKYEELAKKFMLSQLVDKYNTFLKVFKP